MPPRLASIITIAFIVFLFRRDIREKLNVSGALWIPTLWMFIIGSRPVTEWLSMFGIPVPGGRSLEEGNPLESVALFILIACGLRSLGRRQVRLAEFIRSNAWFTVFFFYCFCAILWSDYPFVAFKRWIKILGHPIMILVVLTEQDPEEALKVLIKRCAYVLIPVSILFIKYYPQWGREYNFWTGAAAYTGITKGKNQLGAVCMVLGLFFVWHLLNTRKAEPSKAKRRELLLCAGFLYMIWWVFSMAQSSTSLVSLLSGILMMILLGLPAFSRRLGLYFVVGAIVAATAEAAFDVSSQLLDLLGKDPTMTGRTENWPRFIAYNDNPLIGAGFESFWLGERLERLWAEFPWHPNQAHNGYIETYLNLGIIGLLLLLVLLCQTYYKARLELRRNFEVGRLRLGFLFAILIYNWAEGAFKALHFVFFAFHIIALDYGKRRPVLTSRGQLAEERMQTSTALGAEFQEVR